MAERGLSAAEVAQRVARGQVNDVPSAPTRTIGQIVRGNLLTRFNLLLGSLLVVILVVGPLQDALFGLVIVANTLVGIVQELRAKRTLDRLEVVNAPRARVVRDGQVVELAAGEVVLDDVLEAAAGDQVVVDGEVLEAAGLEVDESLLTGESETVTRAARRRACSRAASWRPGAAATGPPRSGRDAYAVQLTEEARRFTLVRSELRAGVDRILKYVTWAMVPTAALLFVSQLRLDARGPGRAQRGRRRDRGHGPRGPGAADQHRLRRRGAPPGPAPGAGPELPPVETLARVDVICFDKTGTITAGDLAVQELVPQDGTGEGGGRRRPRRPGRRRPEPQRHPAGHRPGVPGPRRLAGRGGRAVLLGPQVERGQLRRPGRLPPRRTRGAAGRGRGRAARRERRPAAPGRADRRRGPPGPAAGRLGRAAGRASGPRRRLSRGPWW